MKGQAGVSKLLVSSTNEAGLWLRKVWASPQHCTSTEALCGAVVLAVTVGFACILRATRALDSIQSSRHHGDYNMGPVQEQEEGSGANMTEPRALGEMTQQLCSERL